MRGDAFPISCSVHQGCPLSPILFLFVAEALSHICTFKAQQRGEILGVTVPVLINPYITGGFVDDTHFVLNADLDNLFRTNTLLDRFNSASRLQIQWQKSAARWLAPGRRP